MADKKSNDDEGPVLGTGAAGDPDNPGRIMPGDKKKNPKFPQPAEDPAPAPKAADDTAEA